MKMKRRVGACHVNGPNAMVLRERGPRSNSSYSAPVVRRNTCMATRRVLTAIVEAGHVQCAKAILQNTVL